MVEKSDLELWNAWRASRDPEPIRVLLDRRSHVLMQYCVRSTGNAERALDLFQETIVELMTEAPLIEHAFCAYVMRMASNLWRNLRRRERLMRPVGDVPDSRDEPMPDPIEEAELQQALKGGLAMLNDGERECVERRYRDGQMLQEIADATGCPINTVKDRSERGLRRLFRFFRSRDFLP